MNDLTIIDNKSIDTINDALKRITKAHKDVSNVKTPSPYIKKKMNMDYVEYSYMRDLADKHFPGWSWNVIKTEFAGTEAYVVHGRLKWFDNGVWREGDSTAAHRIQKKKGSTEYVDLGNDIKAANTDCIKKAFNMYMNISDDVYRNQIEDTELSEEQIDNLMKAANNVDSNKAEEIHKMIQEGIIHGLNYKGSLSKLERLSNE